MKKFFTLLFMCVLATAAWAIEITFDPAVDKGTFGGSAGAFSIEKDGVKLDIENGVVTDTQYRFYKGKYLTVSSLNGSTISKIVFECTAEGIAQYGPGCFTVNVGDYAYEGKIGTWVGGEGNIVFNAASNQVRATKVTVTVGEAGLASPSIKPATGTYFGSVQVSITCSTPGAKIYYTINGNDPTTSSTEYTGAFTLNNSATVKAISALDGEVSAVASAAYEILNPVDVANIAAYAGKADGTAVKFTNPVCAIAQNGNYLYVKDDSGFGLFYGNTGQTYQLGDIIPKNFAGVKTTYGGEPELTTLSGFSAASGNVTINPETINATQVNHSMWAHYVYLENATIDPEAKILTDANGNTAPVYFSMGVTASQVTAGVPYKVWAIVGSYKPNNGDVVYQLLPTKMQCSVVQLADGVYYDGTALYIGSDVTSLGNLQVNPSVIYCYAQAPPSCLSNTFTGYDGTLHVPAASLASYFMAPYWCNFTNIVNNAVEPRSVSISQDSLLIDRGNQMTLTASVLPVNATPNTVLWTSTNNNVATVQNGVVAAVAGGTCDIIASCVDKTAVCHVVVNDILPDTILLSEDNLTLEVDSEHTLTATILPEDAYYTTVSWTTSNSAVATVTNGKVTAVGTGECDITVTCRNKHATCHVKVVDQIVYITLDQHQARLLPNHMLILNPTMTPVSTTLQATSSDPSVAVARIANGIVQIVGVSEGTTTITVGSTDGSAIPDTCQVTVYTEVGDLNSDGFVNMDDLAVMINYLLTNDATGINLTNADTNLKDGVSMDDLSTLINYLLTNEWPWDEAVTETFTVNGVSFKMVAVEGGTFTMGATAEQGSDAWDVEKPAHQVTLSSYSIGETEVTQALWLAVMGSNPSYFTPKNGYSQNLQRPVECVSWYDCQTFISKLNQMTGKNFRLPTEAEWEYAARGGNLSKGYKYAGSNSVDDVAWYWYNIPSQTVGAEGYGTQPVATKVPNELGLYDMSGNVYEWCQDWYGSYTSDAQTNPTGPASGSDRVGRGGSWNYNAWFCRVSNRDVDYLMESYDSLGLRLAL